VDARIEAANEPLEHVIVELRTSDVAQDVPRLRVRIAAARSSRRSALDRDELSDPIVLEVAKRVLDLGRERPRGEQGLGQLPERASQPAIQEDVRCRDLPLVDEQDDSRNKDRLLWLRAAAGAILPEVLQPIAEPIEAHRERSRPRRLAPGIQERFPVPFDPASELLLDPPRLDSIPRLHVPEA
jgi:hypothetical protein